MFKPALILIAALAGPSAMQLPSAPDPKIVEGAPPEYWDGPDAPFTMVVGSPAAVNIVCGPPEPGRVILACTAPDHRVVVMPNPCLYHHEYYARLACHELAHLPRADGRRWEH